MGPHRAKFPLEMSAPLLRANELYRFYRTGDDETMALRGVTLLVQRGEFVALMGPSGSGKSTLLNCIAGLDEPDGGFVEIDDKRVSHRSEAQRADLRARYLGIALQSGNLFEHLSVEQNVRLQLMLARRRYDSDGVRAALSAVGIDHRRRANPSQLSGGEAARAGMVVALAADPPLLLADEPTGEVDAESESMIIALLRDRRARGGGVLVATHSMAVASAADRIERIADGRLINA